MGPLDVAEAGSIEPERAALCLRGSFPDSFLARSDTESLAIRKDFIRTYLERDVSQFGARYRRRRWAASGRCSPTTREPC